MHILYLETILYTVSYKVGSQLSACTHSGKFHFIILRKGDRQMYYHYRKQPVDRKGN